MSPQIIEDIMVQLVLPEQNIYANISFEVKCKVSAFLFSYGSIISDKNYPEYTGSKFLFLLFFLFCLVIVYVWLSTLLDYCVTFKYRSTCGIFQTLRVQRGGYQTNIVWKKRNQNRVLLCPVKKGSRLGYKVSIGLY